MTTRTSKKTIGLISKTTTSHVHHTFLYISFPFLHDYDVKMPNFAFYGGCKQATTKLYFPFWAWIWSLEIHLQEGSPTILGLQLRDKAAMLGVKTKEYFLEEFTWKQSLVPRGQKCFCSWPPTWPPWRHVQTSNWQSKWVGIIAIKTEKTQIHFLSDVLVAVESLDLKFPI